MRTVGDASTFFAALSGNESLRVVQYMACHQERRHLQGQLEIILGIRAAILKRSIASLMEAEVLRRACDYGYEVSPSAAERLCQHYLGIFSNNQPVLTVGELHVIWSLLECQGAAAPQVTGLIKRMTTDDPYHGLQICFCITGHTDPGVAYGSLMLALQRAESIARGVGCGAIITPAEGVIESLGFPRVMLRNLRGKERNPYLEVLMGMLHDILAVPEKEMLEMIAQTLQQYSIDAPSLTV